MKTVDGWRLRALGWLESLRSIDAEGEEMSTFERNLLCDLEEMLADEPAGPLGAIGDRPPTQAIYPTVLVTWEPGDATRYEVVVVSIPDGRTLLALLNHGPPRSVVLPRGGTGHDGEAWHAIDYVREKMDVRERTAVVVLAMARAVIEGLEPARSWLARLPAGRATDDWSKLEVATGADR